jgi:hypothetical protein
MEKSSSLSKDFVHQFTNSFNKNVSIVDSEYHSLAIGKVMEDF